MKISTAIKYYGTPAALARALRVTQPAIGNWLRRTGELMPELYARRLDDITGGRLKFNHAAYGLDPPAPRVSSRKVPVHSRASSVEGSRTVAPHAQQF